MVITYNRHNQIKFPVYPLGSSNWDSSDGLVFIDNLIVDDLNMTGDTLGKRRLQTPHKGLYQLKRSIETFVGVLKQKTNCFIDTNGILFLYEKTRYVQLRYIKIEKIVKKNTSSLLFLQNCRIPFTIPRPPAEEIKYAGVLFFNEFPWMLYDYAETKLKDTKRKI
jgi:hypothetical protein